MIFVQSEIATVTDDNGKWSFGVSQVIKRDGLLIIMMMISRPFLLTDHALKRFFWETQKYMQGCMQAVFLTEVAELSDPRPCSKGF